MKKWLAITLMLIAPCLFAQNSLIQTNVIYTSIRPVNVENSNNAFREVLTQQGGESVAFRVDFSKTTYDSIRVTARFSTNSAGTNTIKFEHSGATIAPTIAIAGVVDTQLTSAWVYVGAQSTNQTFKLYAKAATTGGDIQVYYASYDLIANNGVGGSVETATIKEGGSSVGTGDDHALDFGAGFDLTESPADEFNIVLDYTEDPVNISGSEITGTLAGASGGTGLSSYAIGDMLYITSITPVTFAKLAGVATGNVILSGGVSTAPAYGKVTASHITGPITGSLLNLHGAKGTADVDSLLIDLGTQLYAIRLRIGSVDMARIDTAGNGYFAGNVTADNVVTVTSPQTGYLAKWLGSLEIGTSLIYDDAVDAIGIGTSSPLAIATIHTSKDGANAINADAFGASGSIYPSFEGRLAGGSKASPSETPAGGALVALIGKGYETGAYTARAAGILIQSINQFSATDHSSEILFQATPTSSTTNATYMTMRSTGLRFEGTGFALEYEGTADAAETRITAEDAGQDNAIVWQDTSGTPVVWTSGTPGTYSGLEYIAGGEGAWRVIRGQNVQSKSFVIVVATTASDYHIWRVPTAYTGGITITSISILNEGAGDVVGCLDEMDSDGNNAVAIDSDMTAVAGTNNTNTTLDNATMDAGDYLDWHTTTVAAANVQLTVTFEYVINP